jgi:ketosteroid isomerase-like protein
MAISAQTLIAKIESYYAAVDDFDTDAIVKHFTGDAVMEVPTGDVRHVGHQGLRVTYDRRAREVGESFHGEFTHVVDAEQGRAATRLAVRRTSTAGEPVAMDCIALFTFDGELIKQIVIWMSGANSLK